MCHTRHGYNILIMCASRLDFAKRKATPPGCKCRMVLPSDGETSLSLWDTQDPQGLHEWLSDNLGTDCTTVLHEVQCDAGFLSLGCHRWREAAGHVHMSSSLLSYSCVKASDC